MIVNGVKINYLHYGNKEAKDTIVLLHGWGQNIEMMRSVGDAFVKTHEVVILDLPGYGKSSEPPFAWSVYDYTECIYEFLKKIKIKNPILIGSTDYRNASPLMRDVLVKTVNLDITEDVKKITCPTLLFWGTEDSAVHINSAYELEKLIPNAGLITYEGCTHYAYLERLGNVILALKSFFQS